MDLDTSSICHRCRGIDFEPMLQVSPEQLYVSGRNGYFLGMLSPVTDNNMPMRCQLCRVFHEMLLPQSVASGSSSYLPIELRAYSTFGSGIGRVSKKIPDHLRARDFAHLAVVYASTVRQPPTRFLFHIPAVGCGNQLFKPQPLSPKMDQHFIESCLSFCYTNHAILCDKQQSFVPIHLIDCHATPHAVIRPQRPVQYAALSYVWGTRHADEQTFLTTSFESLGQFHCTQLPKTIADAIVVTKMLGIQYLWVDQICISQSNHKDKQAEISRMDEIYSNAQFTIVAAAGSDYSYGLPGVSTTHRQTSTTVLANGFRFLLSKQNIKQSIESSKWSTRAWTLQEGLLSKRLLFFTDEEVYFECHSMQARESMPFDHSSLHCKQGKLYSFFNSGLYLGKISSRESYVRGSFPNISRFYSIIQQYSTRNMTFEEDSLGAFTGIMKHFQGCQSPIYQLCGIPFLASESPIEVRRCFLSGLLWVHTQSFRPIPPSRRHIVPSWSWAGWKGAIKFIFNQAEIYSRLTPKTTIIALIEGHQEVEQDFDTLSQSPQNLLTLSTYFIKLRASILCKDSFSINFTRSMPRCRVVSKINPPIPPPGYDIPVKNPPSHQGRKLRFRKWDPGFKAHLFSSKGPRTLTHLDKFFVSQDLQAVLIGVLSNQHYKHYKDSVYFLIVEPYGNMFARVGVLEIMESFETLCRDIRFEDKTIIIC